MKKLKVLIIEDSLVFQEFMKEVLIDDIFEKRFSKDGKDGLKVYKIWKPDIILLDMVLPVMSGYSVLQKIRQSFKDDSTTVIIQTTLSDKDDIMECVKLGIQGYIIKPPDPDETPVKILKYYEKVDPERAMVALAELERLKRVQHLSQPISPNESFSPEESEYMEELKFCFEKGSITDSEKRLLKRRAGKLGISEERFIELENILTQDKPQYTPKEMEYIEELKFCLEAGDITDDVRKLLDRYREKLEISEKRAVELEENLLKKDSNGNGKGDNP